jgi:hypothetical protein
MSVTSFRGAVEWALIAALSFGAGAGALAQEADVQSDAKVIQIGPADAHNEVPRVNVPNSGPQMEAPRYWIGLLGGPVPPEVRHHVQIPEQQGVMIREVVPDSPAAKAGLEPFDVLLRANDTDIHEMMDLVDIVRTQGEQQGQVTLDVLRHGNHETVNVAPEERPEHVAIQGGEGNFDQDFQQGIQGFPGDLGQVFGRGGANGRAYNFRHFGPGVIVGGQGMGMAQMPNGVSVSIEKQNDQPTKITVKRGNESWEVTGDDAQSLEQLPEDLRPFVQRMLQGVAEEGFNVQMPMFGNFSNQPLLDSNRINQRIDEMERRLDNLRNRMIAPRLETEPKEAPQEDQTK